LHRVSIVREMVQWFKECSPACEHRSAGKELCSLKPLLHHPTIPAPARVGLKLMHMGRRSNAPVRPITASAREWWQPAHHAQV